MFYCDDSNCDLIMMIELTLLTSVMIILITVIFLTLTNYPDDDMLAIC